MGISWLGIYYHQTWLENPSTKWRFQLENPWFLVDFPLDVWLSKGIPYLGRWTKRFANDFGVHQGYRVCVCGRGDLEVTNMGCSKISFQIEDAQGTILGGLAVGAAATEIAEYKDMAVVILFGGNLTLAGSRWWKLRSTTHRETSVTCQKFGYVRGFKFTALVCRYLFAQEEAGPKVLLYDASYTMDVSTVRRQGNGEQAEEAAGEWNGWCTEEQVGFL